MGWLSPSGRLALTLPDGSDGLPILPPYGQPPTLEAV
jgi:hypothetical protein